MKTCDICQGPLDDEFGNNAEPVVLDGRCCNECNGEVILARLNLVDSYWKKSKK